MFASLAAASTLTRANIGDLLRRAERRGVDDVALLRIALANLRVRDGRRRRDSFLPT